MSDNKIKKQSRSVQRVLTEERKKKVMCPYLKTMKVRENKHSCEASLVPNAVFSVKEGSKCSSDNYDTCPIFLAHVLRSSRDKRSESARPYRRGYRKAA